MNSRKEGPEGACNWWWLAAAAQCTAAGWGGLRVGRALNNKSVQLALGMDRTVLAVAGGAGVLRLECNSRVGQEWRPGIAVGGALAAQ